jgi:two-component system, cell cycle sensor histidine kinase and response regulator CckA
MNNQESAAEQHALHARILVVEDEALIATFVQRVLRRLGHTVVDRAASAVDAVEKVGRHLPDLVMLDIKLEGELTGIDAGRRIRAEYGTPFIYASAYVDEATKLEAAATEPFGFLAKPYTAAAVKLAVEEALRRIRIGIGPAVDQ